MIDVNYFCWSANLIVVDHTKLGRRAVRLSESQLAAVSSLSVRAAAQQLGVSVNTYQNARRVYQQTSPADAENLAQNVAA